MKKILVVDDEQDLCNLVKKVLEKTGQYQVMVTSLPEEVLSLCQREQPDLILLDIVMPNMDGNQLIYFLKDDPRTEHILIIVTSGMGEMVYQEKRDQWSWQPNRKIVQERGRVIKERDAKKAADAFGVDDFLAKPFSPTTLRMVIEDVFEEAEKRKNLDDEVY